MSTSDQHHRFKTTRYGDLTEAEQLQLQWMCKIGIRLRYRTGQMGQNNSCSFNDQWNRNWTELRPDIWIWPE